MSTKLPIFMLLLTCSLCASEFRTGQAARAVIGQSSFSAKDTGIVARALSVSKNVLYIADTSDRILSFNTSHLVSSRSGGCAVCVTNPTAVVNQGVIPGVASSTAFGSTVVAADASSHRVLIWRGATAAKPAVSLTLGQPVSVAFDGQRLFVGDAALHRVLVWKSLPTADDQPPDALLGQADQSSDSLAADTIQSPIALAVDGNNLFVADSAARRVLVFTPGDTPLTANHVLNAASLQPGPIAPGTLLSIDYAAAMETPHVLLDGVELPILEVGGDGIQTQVPYLLHSSSASLMVRGEHADGTSSFSDAVAISFVPVSPGIYAFGGKEPRTGLLLHQGEPLTLESPAKAGDVLTVWATGLGAIDSESETKEVQAPVTAYVNGQPALVVSAHLPESAIGVYEIQIQVPRGLARGQSATLVLSQSDVKSNAVVFPLIAEN